MDRAIKKKKKMITLAILLSIALPVGIVTTILCAVNKIWVVMAIGIVLIVAGFYGAPICWSRLGDYSKMIALLRGIEQQNLYTVQELAAYTTSNEKSTIARIQSAINSGYLLNYLFVDNQRLELIKSRKQELHQVTFKCTNCGALVYADQNASNTRCEYCGRVYSGEEIDVLSEKSAVKK